MGSQKNTLRGKSGLLTGFMIASTGLIAGFHGVELATQGGKPGHSTEKKPSVIRNSRNEPPKSSGNDADKLDSLIQRTLRATDRPSAEPGRGDEAGDSYDTALIVNRSLKQDWMGASETPVKSPSPREAEAETVAEAKEKEDKPQEAAAPLSDPAFEFDDKKTGDQKHSSAKGNSKDFQPPETQATHADNADIALFAGDIPLPSALKPVSVYGPASPKQGNGSPLVPRVFNSGKAFGGLAEREFQRRERRCMTTALYFEARGEPEAGQVAVGQVVMNRVKSPDYPDTICGVVYQGSQRSTGCQFSFTCDGKVDKPNNKKQWELAKRLSNRVLEGKVWLESIGNSTHYHADYVYPVWRKKMAVIKKIGRHIFYKSPNISLTETYQRYTSGKRS